MSEPSHQLTHPTRIEYALLGLLALLWGSSYLLIKVAVAEIPPVTLIAMRVAGAAALLFVVMSVRGETLPADAATWRLLLVQSFFNATGAWLLLAWGQQHVDAALASVLNSTSPLFVFFITLFVTRHESVPATKLVGAVLGVVGVTLIVGVDALAGLGLSVAGQLACIGGSMLYAMAAIYGRRFGHISALATATGTMTCAAVVLVPLALLVDQPWTLRPSAQALGAVATLSVLCTGLALLLYFRLLRTLGSMGTASQAYLRASVGVVLGVVVLGETVTTSVLLGLVAAIVGVALINWPRSSHRVPSRR